MLKKAALGCAALLAFANSAIAGEAPILNFNFSDGAYPNQPLVQDAAGNLYVPRRTAA